ncbi:MAG: glycoside hydrolase family 15 protein, partial [Myxococcales bacterium]
AHAFQFDLGEVAAGGEAWTGIAVIHHADPFADAQASSALDGWLAERGAKAVVEAELAEWAAFQARVRVPAGASADEEALVRQSAVVLAMSQVKGDTAFLREHLTRDGEPRRTRFASPAGTPVTLPGTIRHRGAGAVLASLPPGEWTYAWIRDGAYAVAAMAALGLHAEARAALKFYLDAEGGRFRDWDELKPYAMPPYLITLTRYHGFGVEETDFNDFGPNLEFDGFGLFLWALHAYERDTGDATLADEAFGTITSRVADALIALVDPQTGLIRRDSSIWETHWKGRERFWTYTSLTAARGLCDAAALADARGGESRAAKYRVAGSTLRRAIARELTDGTGALASNREELQSGGGYYDAAVLDAIAMGLFRPEGRIAQATLDAMDAQLRTAAGPGWSRNDDFKDHAGREDLSPWGGEYDSAEWGITDLRGAVAVLLAGRTARADEL